MRERDTTDRRKEEGEIVVRKTTGVFHAQGQKVPSYYYPEYNKYPLGHNTCQK